MKPITTKMPVLYRRALFSVVFVSLVTGWTFFIMSRWLMVEGDFGLEKHPLQFPVLKLHGACAFMMMMFFGSLLVTHIPLGWRTKRLRLLGISLASTIALQIITAWFLYYLSSDSLRTWVGYAHLGVGSSIPCLLFVHIWIGSRRTRK